MYFVGAPKISAGGRRMVNMVKVTPLIWRTLSFDKNKKESQHTKIFLKFGIFSFLETQSAVTELFSRLPYCLLDPCAIPIALIHR